MHVFQGVCFKMSPECTVFQLKSTPTFYPRGPELRALDGRTRSPDESGAKTVHSEDILQSGRKNRAFRGHPAATGIAETASGAKPRIEGGHSYRYSLRRGGQPTQNRASREHPVGPPPLGRRDGLEQYRASRGHPAGTPAVEAIARHGTAHSEGIPSDPRPESDCPYIYVALWDPVQPPTAMIPASNAVRDTINRAGR